MNFKHILIFFISFLGTVALSFSQDKAEETPLTDSIQHFQKYGLRIGLDLSKPVRTFLDDKYQGFEIMADYRISQKLFIAAELGNETKDYIEPNLTAETKGSYIKAGIDYNAHNNWLGLNNVIFSGFRYGFSTFDQELLSYSPFITNQTFPAEIKTDPKKFSGLTGQWAELIFGIKTEIFNNLYLSLNLQLKFLLSEDLPDNFDNLYIPGFNRTFDTSEWGAGFGYGISYLIPIFKK